jgi:glutathione S-transferase
MSEKRALTFFHAPQSRSAGVRVLLEELGARPGVDYTLHALNLRAGETRQPAYLAVNPMGKVPALLHGDALVTEQVAVYLYLGDLFPQAGLTPGLDDPQRGPYLRWLAYYGSSFEPAVVDRSQGHPPASPQMCPYGDFDTMLKTVTDPLAKGPYLLGERFTVADVLWGVALAWTVGFKLVPETPPIRAYIDRVTQRPAAKRAALADQELLERFGASGQ